MHKGALTALILAGLLGSPKAAETLFWIFLKGKYGRSSTKLFSARPQRVPYCDWDDQLKIEWRRYYNLVTHLKKDNLLQTRDGILHINRAGRFRLRRMREVLAKRLPQSGYFAEASDHWLLVAFDVPEKEKYKREWLRERLREMGFVLLQKSLWGARKRLSREFLADMRRFRMIEYVDIFSISKRGTLRRMT